MFKLFSAIFVSKQDFFRWTLFHYFTVNHLDFLWSFHSAKNNTSFDLNLNYNFVTLSYKCTTCFYWSISEDKFCPSRNKSRSPCCLKGQSVLNDPIVTVVVSLPSDVFTLQLYWACQTQHENSTGLVQYWGQNNSEVARPDTWPVCTCLEPQWLGLIRAAFLMIQQNIDWKNGQWSATWVAIGSDSPMLLDVSENALLASFAFTLG